MDKVGVSCICSTYKRTPFPLEELLYCFLAQDYPVKELIIANDDPSMTIEFEHPDVTIINYDKRFSFVHEKEDDAKRHSKHKLIMLWDDDDIFAPWAISTAVKYYKQGSKGYIALAPYFKSSPVKNVLVPSTIPGFAIMTKELWERFASTVEYPVSYLKPYHEAIVRDKMMLTMFKQWKEYGQGKLTEDEVCYAWRPSKNWKWGQGGWLNKSKHVEGDKTVCILEPKLKYKFEPFGYEAN